MVRIHRFESLDKPIEARPRLMPQRTININTPVGA